MKAMLICDVCGYQMVGVGAVPDDALKAAVAGMQAHQDLQHGAPMTPDRFITGLRIGAPETRH